MLCVDCKKVCSLCPGTSFVMRPCESALCNTETASTSILSFSVRKKILYPQFLEPVKLLQKSKTSVSVALNLSTHGTAYCLALDSAQSLYSTSTVISQGTSAVYHIPRTSLNYTVFLNRMFHTIYKIIQSLKVLLNITVSNLLPDSDYILYCYTESNFGDSMDLSTVLTGMRF